MREVREIGLSCKESSKSLTKPLSCPKRENETALLCSEPFRSKVGGPSKVFAILCGMGPPGVDGDSERDDNGVLVPGVAVQSVPRFYVIHDCFKKIPKLLFG